MAFMTLFITQLIIFLNLSTQINTCYCNLITLFFKKKLWRIQIYKLQVHLVTQKSKLLYSFLSPIKKTSQKISQHLMHKCPHKHKSSIKEERRERGSTFDANLLRCKLSKRCPRGRPVAEGSKSDANSGTARLRGRQIQLGNESGRQGPLSWRAVTIIAGFGLAYKKPLRERHNLY